MRRRTYARLAGAIVMAALLVTAGCSDDGDSGADSGDDAGADSTETTEASGPSGEFELLSYNVAGLPQQFSSVNPEEHIPLIAPLLEPYDLVLTQEDFDWWVPLLDTWDFANYHERLRSESTHEYRSERHPGPEAVGLDTSDRPLFAVGDGLGYLSRFPLTDVQRVPWKECFGGPDSSDGGAGDCLAMKGFAVATVELADGVEVDVYNLHMEAGGSERDQQLQADDVAALGDFILEHSDGRAVILGGDTNLHTDPPGPDAHEDSGDGADLEIWETFLEATGLTDACDATECDGPGRIDKFAFRSSDAVEVEVLTHEFLAEEFVDDAGEALSDHEPLAVRFELTPT
jgi:hypothetical protein